MLLKLQEGFKIERHNIFTKEIEKIALSSNDDKRIESIETSANGMSIDNI